MFYQNQQSIAMFSANSGGGDQARALNAAVNAGVWMHAGGVVTSAASRKTYVNGVLDATNAASFATGALSQTYVGTYYNSGVQAGFNCDGDIAEVGIWDVELTAEEWEALGAGCSPLLIRPQNLRAYYPLLGRAANEEDWSGHLPLTNVNAATAADHPRVILPYQRRVLVSAAAAPAGITGTLASTLAGVSMSASGLVDNKGTFASTLDGCAMSASGIVGSAPSGTFASTLDGVSMAAAGQIIVPGAFASTLAGVSMSAAGIVDNRGTFASSLGGVSMVASGTVAAHASGAFSSTLDGVSMTAYGYVGIPPQLAGFFLRLPKNPRKAIRLP